MLFFERLIHMYKYASGYWCELVSRAAINTRNTKSDFFRKCVFSFVKTNEANKAMDHRQLDSNALSNHAKAHSHVAELSAPSSSGQVLQSIYMVNTHHPQQQPHTNSQQPLLQQQQQQQLHHQHHQQFAQPLFLPPQSMAPNLHQSHLPPQQQQPFPLQGGGYVAPALNWQVCEALFYSAVGRPSSVNLYVGDGRVAIGPDVSN